jgi:UDP-N-acetylglucosamine--N-acetylmuramyl-(pentapeptide) pyrophosphoryl-undecaprenol N-acetylglucosamine transferase
MGETAGSGELTLGDVPLIRSSGVTKTPSPKPLIAIACGGTGGHLVPGVAVGEQLLLRGCDVTLLVSPKEVDQHAVTSALGMKVATLPAVGMTRGKLLQFAAGFWNSYRAAKQLFRERPPQAVLAMGGFTSAPPVLAGRACGATTFLHESNTIPGKANRWLAHFVNQAFVGFPTAAGRLHHTNILCTGTPVRPQFQPAQPVSCRMALGLAPERPVLLVMGGSQGASGINDLVLQAVPALLKASPDLQFLHLTGPSDVTKVQSGYDALKAKAVVRPFLTEMELALGAANVAVSRAGGSSLAELAAMRLPSVLIPYPTAADNHQLHNANAYVETGAALLLEQKSATGEDLASLILRLLTDNPAHAAMAKALEDWHNASAAELIAERMMALTDAMRGENSKSQAPGSREIPISKLQTPKDARRIGAAQRVATTAPGVWNLDLFWSLELGAWSFVSQPITASSPCPRWSP